MMFYLGSRGKSGRARTAIEDNMDEARPLKAADAIELGLADAPASQRPAAPAAIGPPANVFRFRRP